MPCGWARLELLSMKNAFPHCRPAVLAVALAAVCTSFAVQAGDDSRKLDDIVVTGTRQPVSLRQLVAATTVIGRDEIERSQAQSLLDLLRGRAGIQFANNGGAGKASSLFLRGTESDHTLLLIDGVRLGSASSGGAAWQDIPLDQIERIEIVRGPYSSLYGSEAIGGVIQIFTRDGSSAGAAAFNPNLAVSLGSHGHRKISVGAGGQNERGWYSLGLSHDETDGFNACRGRAAQGSWGQPGYVAGAGCFADEPDRDGYRNQSISGNAGVNLNEQWRLQGNALLARTRTHYDGSFVNEAEGRQQVLGAQLGYQLNEDFSLTLNIGRSADHSENYKNGVWKSTFNTDRSQAGLQADWNPGNDARLLAGFEWNRDALESDTAYVQDRRNNRAVYAQWMQTFAAHSLQLSARHDRNDQFGNRTTGSAQWGWQLSEALRLSASWGNAFKAPTFNELYYPGFGNAALRPERARNLELGLRGEHLWGGWNVQLYQNTVDDLIAYDASIFAPGNVDRARIRGLEIGADTDVAGWQVRAALTWLNPKSLSGTHRGNLLPRRAKQSARIDVDRSFGDFEFGASLLGAGRRYDDLANRTALGGYGLTDLRAGWRFAPQWQLQASVENVFDKRYETAAFYHQAGRTWQLALRYGGVR
ncbi:TonB-dependent vitamin B12 receptor [Lysobacteraceae bacterium NML08-0793]|nr:TonB-dependent vitamin B12 receptor [Xanthomonadaceae bacterium NML08-0793]